MASQYTSFLTQRERQLKSVLTGFLVRCCAVVERKAKTWAPAATGTLRKSIYKVVAFPIGSVIVNAPYAKYVEGVDDQGNPRVYYRHFHSWKEDPLFRAWARRRGFDTENPSGGLWVWGYNIPFMRGAMKESIPQLTAELGRLKLPDQGGGMEFRGRL